MPGKGKTKGSTTLTLGEEGHLVLHDTLQHSFQIDKRFPPVWSHCAGQDKFGTSTEFPRTRIMQNGGCVLPGTLKFEKLFKLGVGAQMLVEIQVAAHVMCSVRAHTAAPQTGFVRPNKIRLVLAETKDVVHIAHRFGIRTAGSPENICTFKTPQAGLIVPAINHTDAGQYSL
jgi:hypothetical protein